MFTLATTLSATGTV